MWQENLPNLTFLEAAKPLQDHSDFMALESLNGGQYSYIACQAFGCFEVKNGQAFWNGQTIMGEPIPLLKEKLALYHQENLPDGVPFQSGAIGYFSYDFGAAQLGVVPITQSEISDVYLNFYATILVLDHHNQTCKLYASGFPHFDEKTRQQQAMSDIVEFKKKLNQKQSSTKTMRTIPVIPKLKGQDYKNKVERIKQYILAGDVYQVNLAAHIEVPLPSNYNPWTFYLELREQNPAPYCAYIKTPTVTFCSSSPESFLEKRGSHLRTSPIKGTIARSNIAHEDEALKNALATSDKDRAENIMIVDLLRNDFSKVCKPNTVKVPQLCAIESFAALHHMVSTVEGELRDGQHALDAFMACFPGGSITGAPKVRAMQIIKTLEAQPRGIYCGAIGAFGFNGDMQTSIAIRTVSFTKDKVTFCSGAGITLLSQPQAEFAEIELKANRILKAFGT